MLNYGYIPSTISADDEELDAYLIGKFEPATISQKMGIAIMHRTNRDYDKLIVSKNNLGEAIKALAGFQGQRFE